MLVSGKYGNSNTLKIEEDGGRYLVALKRSRVPVYTDMEIFEEYNRVALERGWKPLKSPRSLREWFNSPRVEPLWYDAVYAAASALLSTTGPLAVLISTAPGFIRRSCSSPISPFVCSVSGT